MHEYAIGKPYIEGIYQYQEGCKFVFNESGPAFTIFFSNPSQSEINTIDKGNIQVGLYRENDIIDFLIKIGKLEWMDAPFSVHLLTNSDFEPPEIDDENIGYGLSIFLVNADDGLIVTMKYIGLPHKTSKLLRDAILKQKEMPFDKKIYNQRVTNLLNRYTPKQLAKKAEIVEKLNINKNNQ